jgi:hypothetical protein
VSLLTVFGLMTVHRKVSNAFTEMA